MDVGDFRQSFVETGLVVDLDQMSETELDRLLILFSREIHFVGNVRGEIRGSHFWVKFHFEISNVNNWSVECGITIV